MKTPLRNRVARSVRQSAPRWSDLFPEACSAVQPSFRGNSSEQANKSMSETRIVHCDRCHSIVEADLTRIRIETGAMRRSGFEVLDLCGECAPMLLDLIKTKPVAEAEAAAG